jgi:hypothetical protein
MESKGGKQSYNEVRASLMPTRLGSHYKPYKLGCAFVCLVGSLLMHVDQAPKLRGFATGSRKRLLRFAIHIRDRGANWLERIKLRNRHGVRFRRVGTGRFFVNDVSDGE